ncbi:hypothetical protein Lal_00027401 [Lupinus albus]|nr:hypothetical protein Lal_00027401 [Lupinus albus]
MDGDHDKSVCRIPSMRQTDRSHILHIELCCDDDEDLEFGSSEVTNITYGTHSSFFVTIDSAAGQDIQNRKNNLSNDFDNDLFIGMQFESKDATINAIKQFHIKNSVDYIVVESRPDRYVGQLSDDPGIQVKALVKEIVTRFGYTCYAPGTIVGYATSRHDDSSSLILDRVFWAFKPCIEGFGFCKPILQVDGTFLTGKYSGTLLIASSQDGYELMRPPFERMLDDLRQKNPRAAAWLDNIPKEKWTQSYDEGRRYGHMTTNLAECVNGVLKGSIVLPITSLVQATYHRLNSWFLHHRNEATSMIMAGHIYCEELTKVLNENNRKATCQTIQTFSRELGVFVVEVPGRDGSGHSKVYGREFEQIGNEEYWPHYSGIMFIPNLIMRRIRTRRP